MNEKTELIIETIKRNVHAITLGIFAIVLLYYAISLMDKKVKKDNVNYWAFITPSKTAKKRDWNYIVMHHSASEKGNVQSINRDHIKRKKWDGIGYHFVIGNGNGMKLGKIEATWRWFEQREGAHAGNKKYNEEGIGICLIGDYENNKVNEFQLKRTAFLCALLIKNKKIPIKNIKMHRDVKKKGTKCPGKNFDENIIRRLKSMIQERLDLVKNGK